MMMMMMMNGRVHPQKFRGVRFRKPGIWVRGCVRVCVCVCVCGRGRGAWSQSGERRDRQVHVLRCRRGPVMCSAGLHYASEMAPKRTRFTLSSADGGRTHGRTLGRD